MIIPIHSPLSLFLLLPPTCYPSFPSCTTQIIRKLPIASPPTTHLIMTGILSGLLDFAHSQLFLTLPTPAQSFAGKTVIVTGSNTGLGREAARHFAQLKASTLILAVRDMQKGEAARQSILQTTSADPSSVQVWQLDLSSYASVQAFAQRVSQLPRVDAVIENAGIAATKYKRFEDNESTITTNVVSTFLLALLMLPKLKETAHNHNVRPTLTIVSSEVHAMTSFPERNAPSIFDTLNDPQTANMRDRYQVSKLLEVLVVREWAAQRPALEYPVTINCLNPGLCHSELSRDSGFILEIFKFFLARTTEAGSRTLVNAAEQGPETHGMYLSDCKVKRPAPFVLGEEGQKAQKNVWAELKTKLEKIQPGVTNNL